MLRSLPVRFSLLFVIGEISRNARSLIALIMKKLTWNGLYTIAGLLTLALCLPFSARAQSFDYPDFSASSLAATHLQLNGNATAPVTNATGASVLRLTFPVGSQAGSAFSYQSVQLASNASFSTAFSFQLTDGGGGYNDGNQPPEPPGADGVVFVLTTVSNNVGSLGQGVGYQGIANSVGIKFDTWQDSAANGFSQDSDPNGNFVAIYTNGSTQTAGYVSTASANPANLPEYYTPATYMKNGDIWYVWIDYNGVTDELDVRLSDGINVRPSQPQLTQIVPLNNPAVLGSAAEVFAGFTSGTGGQWNSTDILTWQFNVSYQPIIGRVQVGVNAVGGNVSLNVSGGTDGLEEVLLMTTDITTPVADWIPVATNAMDANGNGAFSNFIKPGPQSEFFAIKVPASSK